MQQLAGSHQRGRAAATIDAILERQVRVANCLHELCANDRKRANGALAAIVADHVLMNSRVAGHLVVRVAREVCYSSPYPVFTWGLGGTAAGGAASMLSASVRSSASCRPAM